MGNRKCWEFYSWNYIDMVFNSNEFWGIVLKRVNFFCEVEKVN